MAKPTTGEGNVWEIGCVRVIMGVSGRGRVMRLGGYREAPQGQLRRSRRDQPASLRVRGRSLIMLLTNAFHKRADDDQEFHTFSGRRLRAASAGESGRLGSVLKSRYDFIVCGSGSSGSVVAGRLAQQGPTSPGSAALASRLAFTGAKPQLSVP
jgi:hypothetical protein